MGRNKRKRIKAYAKKAANWKSPGPDGIQNFWLKYLKATHRSLEMKKLKKQTITGL